jgi:hypothetical protein
MAQNLGAAQPIVDALQPLNPATWFKRTPKPDSSRQDTSWHDEMVRRANASFVPVKTPPKTPPKTTTRTAPKPTPKRTPPRAASKRR